MNVHPRRVWAILRKELREFRRNRSVLFAMAIFPAIFLVQPLVVVFLLPSDASGTLAHEHLLLYLLGVPVLASPVLAAHAVAGERQQGSLEPVLATPIRREEFLLGKALAAIGPAMAISYAVYALFLGLVAVFADRGVASAILQPVDVVAQLVFTPLLAGVAIWIGIAVSTRSSDARTAQQVSVLASLPLVLVTTTVAFDVIHPTLVLALAAAAALGVIDLAGWRLVAPLFDRERLITGTRS